MYQRKYLSLITERLEKEARRFIQVIYGPRQVGKTTLAEQFTDQTTLDYHYASADGIGMADSGWIEEQWDVARLKCRQSPKKISVLILDEVQKITNWSEYVKREWDRDTKEDLGVKVLLLGSSRLLLQQGLTESLTGRFESIYVGHWTFSEMYEAFGITPEQYAWFGGYPGSVPLFTDEERWKRYILDSIIETSISRDILMLTRVHKPALMRRLFEIGCNWSGQILSYSKLIGQLQDAGNTTTLAHYLKLLDTAGLLRGIEKYGQNLVRQRASSPKFQVYNQALLSAQQPYRYEEIRKKPDDWGRWVESVIGAHLLNYSLTEGFQLFYWRFGNHEMDFVISNQRKVIGLEVKSTSIVNRSGINEFRKRVHPDKVYIVGKDEIPWQEFLKINPVELF